VFDTNFTADLTIIEEGTELILRLYKALVRRRHGQALPQFTSCSPGWVKFIEHFYPNRCSVTNLSSAKSPQQMFGAVIKTYYAQMNKHRSQGHRVGRADAVLGEEVRVQPAGDERQRVYKDIDYGLTTRELVAR
jgi:iron only hydrogenase large subunit-like protein